MPLLGDYTWSETNETVSLSVNLKGVSLKQADIFLASTILKINYQPFLIDLNLFQEIISSTSKAVCKDGVLHICLTKTEPQLWGQLCFIGSKEEITERREKAIKLHDAQNQQNMEMLAARKVDEERMMLREHMALEERERQRMDDIKGREKKNAEDAMFDAFSRLRSATKEDLVDRSNNKDDCLPPPRKQVHATFRHTPRLFKTPSRESTKKAEREFIIKNVSNLRDNALLVDVSNSDPVWLNSKGDEFYKRGDIGSAINAYSEALKTDNTMVETLAKRAACFLKIREAEHAIADCIHALRELDGSTKDRLGTNEERLLFRKKLLMRLGMAHCLNADHEKALELFLSILQLDKNDKAVLQNIIHLKALLEATKWKKGGDRHFSVGNIEKAVADYTKAISVDPTHIKCIMNRATCHLALYDSDECTKDCTMALDLLSRDKRTNGSPTCAVATILSPTPGTKRKWQVVLLCRRAAAKEIADDLQGALDDLEQAKSIIRNDDGVDVKSIAKDIDELKAKMSSLKTPSS